MRKALVQLLIALCLVSTTAAYAVDASPSQCYRSYLGALYYAKDLKALYPYFTRDQQQAMKQLSPADQANRLKELKEHYVGTPRFTEEKVSGDKAHLKAVGVGAAGAKTFTAYVDVDMVHEDGYWKVSAAAMK